MLTKSFSKFLFSTHQQRDSFLHQIKTIDTLVLGSSHSHNGVIPKLITQNTFNLSCDSQDLFIANDLLQKYSPKLKSLKNIVLFCSVFSVGYDAFHSRDRNRTNIFRLLYNIPNKKQKTLSLLKTKLYISIATIFTPSHDKKSTGEYIKEGYGEKVPDFHITSHYKHNQKETRAIDKLESIINSCLQNNIKIILVIPPVRNDYIKKLPNSSDNHLFEKVFKLISKYNITLLNFFNSSDFKKELFFDSHHLNKKGAIKLTNFIKEEINKA